MAKKTSGARMGAMKPSRPKAEMINRALSRAAQEMAGWVLRDLANAKEFAASNPAPFREWADKHAQEMLDFTIVSAGTLAANPGFVRRMARQQLEFAADRADPEHAAMLDEALALLDRIGQQVWCDMAATDGPGSTLTQPSPMEGEGSLGRAAHAAAAGAAGVAA